MISSSVETSTVFDTGSMMKYSRTPYLRFAGTCRTTCWRLPSTRRRRVCSMAGPGPTGTSHHEPWPTARRGIASGRDAALARRPATDTAREASREPFSAYLYLSHQTGEKSAKTVPSTDGLLVVDFAVDGRPIGVEITAPTAVPLDRLNRLLADLGDTPGNAFARD